ncbi:MAG TPA: VWA domain-containing protein [Verrucomicrobiae bacterium]|nr:VWA domain-containing protein [Verrucomicrobiae bacterium]
MTRRSAIRLLASSSAGFFYAKLRAAQQNKASTRIPQEFTIHAESRLVLLDVSVRDRSGRLVPGLSKDNFTVLEDGKRQEVTSFQAGDDPVTVGILVDESFSMAPKRPDVLTAAMTFIGSSNPEDEIFVINFNDKVSYGLPPDVPFSDNIRQLSHALDLGEPEGKTRLYDAVLEGLRRVELGRRRKKALLVISDGGDNASEHTRAQMLSAVEDSLATIYSVGIFYPEDIDRDPHILRQIARISGGGSYFPETVPATIPLCRGIAKEIRSRYTLGYIPQAGKGRGLIRHVQVIAEAQGMGKLTAHSRTSYRYVETSHDGAEQ